MNLIPFIDEHKVVDEILKVQYGAIPKKVLIEKLAKYLDEMFDNMPLVDLGGFNGMTAVIVEVVIMDPYGVVLIM